MTTLARWLVASPTRMKFLAGWACPRGQDDVTQNFLSIFGVAHVAFDDLRGDLIVVRPIPWWSCHPVTSLPSRSHRFEPVNWNSELVHAHHWTIDKIFSGVSTWMLSDVWCSGEHGLWHIALEPGDVAKSVQAFFVAAVKAGLQPVDDGWWSALTPFQSCLGGRLWFALLP